MMIIMRSNASQKEVDAVVERIEENGLSAHVSAGSERTIIGVIGDTHLTKDDFKSKRVFRVG